MNTLILQYVKNSGVWIKQRWLKIPERDNQLTMWFMLAFAITTTFLAIITALGTPFGPSILSQSLNIALFIFLNWLILCVWTLIVSLLLSFTYVPLPRIFLAGFTYTITATLTVLIISKSGVKFSIMIGLLTASTALILGLLFVIFSHPKITRTIKVAGLVSILIVSLVLLLPNTTQTTSIDIPAFSQQADIDNPGKLGNYEVNLFTYGSGQDRHRKAFGDEVDYLTDTVDASDFVTRWSDKRANFWGFTQNDLPVNGRAWVPDGQGPFPIMLIVHGNHAMEDFSTGGYDYLGELLASRGFITISVDEDFINYSNIYGSPNRNYELRTWVMLQHIIQLQHMNDSPNTFLSNKVDFQNLVFAGHSRGGQAALMAADYQGFFPDLELDINVKGVIAISPTDKLVADKRAKIHNTSYLLLQGARDADVNAFRDAAFYRTTFDHNDDSFKTSLYIENANHTQFNTDWGSMDLSLPRGIFLNQQTTMQPEAQQQIAKVYISAFLERIFNKELTYDKLFQNHQYGNDWLPHTTYVSKYQTSDYTPVIKYRTRDLDTLTLDGFSKQEIYQPTDRDDNKRKLPALELAWENEATYTLAITSDEINTADKLNFTMANIDTAENANPPNIQLEIEMTNGETHILPFDDYMPFPPVITTEFTRFGLFENTFRDDKYHNAWEPVFQTFEVPVAPFKGDNIQNIHLHFSGSPGNILIEEIGLEKSE